MLAFLKETLWASIVLPNGKIEKRKIEIRTHPITQRTSRIAFSRSQEREPGAESLPLPPPFSQNRDSCPFCKENLERSTPKIIPDLASEGRLLRGASVLFPNLFPYGAYSAVSLFDDNHFVEIGTATLSTYTDCFLNCRNYLLKILQFDPAAFHMAITQNHLPSAGGSLLHPHLQVQADRIPTNNQRFLMQRGTAHRKQTGGRLFSDYLKIEKTSGDRYIGNSGKWEWVAAFAPEGFFEIWGILAGVTSLRKATDDDWQGLAQGILHVQQFYRSLGRNGYNLGLIFLEDGSDILELRAVLTVRSNYAPWVRSDFTGFEVMLGDIATFTAPEQTAEMARNFW